MSREKAKKYADEKCGENDDYLNVYHAYEDGYSSGSDLQPKAELFVGIVIGIFFTLLVIAYLHDTLNIFNCKPS